VSGAFPDWLRGRLVRTAPAVFEHNGWSARHWFDGMGMLYRFSIEGPDRVAWAQRLLDSEASRAALATGRIPLATFASGNGRSLLRRILEPIPKRTDNANVNVVPMGPEWVAMTETDRQLAVDPETLETRREVPYDDDLPHGTSMTAHPLRDVEHDLVVNVGTVRGARPEIVAYAHAPGSRRRVPFARWKVRDIPYIHSFGLAADCVVVVAHPMTYRPVTLLWSNRFVEHMKWRPEDGTRLVVFDRASGAISMHETDPLFVFHTVNTFRDGADIVLDVVAHDDPSPMTQAFRVERIGEWSHPPLGLLTRLRITPGRALAQVERLSGDRIEFPMVSAAVRGRRQRLVWGASVGAESAIVGVDVERATTRTFSSPGLVFGEPIFVPAPGAASEDDGVVLAVGTEPAASRAKLVAVDARDMRALAEAVVDAPIPLGFHGSFEAAASGRAEPAARRAQ
jgi:carotenoid cleavage dioxygenase-like enzyme